jgi:hypothetical protein
MLWVRVGLQVFGKKPSSDVAWGERSAIRAVSAVATQEVFSGAEAGVFDGLGDRHVEAFGDDDGVVVHVSASEARVAAMALASRSNVLWP